MIPKEYWIIEPYGKVECIKTDKHWSEELYNQFKSFGNCFKTQEEAEQVLEKLKAWKRLKDIGFHFLGWDSTYKGDSADFYIDWIEADSQDEIVKDLDLLFGGDNE